jgi:hypothetical protein
MGVDDQETFASFVLKVIRYHVTKIHSFMDDHDHHLPLLTHLQSVSPALSALLVSRVLSTDSISVDDTHCPRCGFFILDGSSNTRTLSLKTQRRKKTQATARRRVIQKSCSICGFVHTLPLERGNAASFPNRNKTIAPVINIQAQTNTSKIPIPSSNHDPSPLPKSKTKKKKSALQELLARNRVRQEQEHTHDAQAGGSLASFLGGL